jgi:tetratricopeptide (TPR) repeat protein
MIGSRSRFVLGVSIGVCLACTASSLAGAQTDAAAVNLDTLKQRADDARTAGRIDEAIDLYSRAVRQQPAWVEGHWYLGTIYYDRERHAECRDAFTRVVEHQPQNGAAWAFRGLCEYRLRQYAVALDHLNRANQTGVGDDLAFQAVVGYHRAILLARFEQFERALEIDANVVRGGNTTPATLDALGIAMLRWSVLPDEVPPEKRELVQLAGRAGAFEIGMMKDAAEQAFEQLVSTYSDTPNVHYLYGTYLARDRPEEGIEQFKIEIRKSPGHVLARVQLAQELIKQGDFDGAAPYATEAARLAPRNFMARKVIGQVKLQAGDVTGAIAELEAARVLEPSSPSVRYHLARAYQRAGRAADAKRERAEFTRLESIQQKQRGEATAPAGEKPPEQVPP